MASFGEINLLESNIDEPNVLENFKRIKTFLRDTVLLKTGFVFRTFTIPAGVMVSYKHNLNFIPRDVILTSATNAAVVTWHYEKFDRDNIYLTVSAPTTIRAFLGLYKDDIS